ncbi:MAG: HEPN domain-containing protein [Candidatus Hadarchaeota archaeon]
MSLEELLRDRIIRKTRPNRKLATDSLARARRDIDTARTLISNRKLDWSLAVSYNSMLQAGRALMFDQGYIPSSKEGHVAVVKFLRASLGAEIVDRVVMVLNGLRKKRHRIVYEAMDIVSGDEAEQALKWAEEFVKRIDGILQKKPGT